MSEDDEEEGGGGGGARATPPPPDEAAIALVMEFTGVGRDAAMEALAAHDGDARAAADALFG